MWYYLEDEQQRGPVMDADLETLRRDGKINPETLVWREGMANWQPLREVKLNLPEASGMVCAECGKSFPADEVLRLSGRWVCAACKPVFLQRLSEGSLAGGATATGMVSESQVRERDYEHDIGSYFSQAWALFKSDAGGLIAATVVVGLCLAVVNVIPYLSVVTGLVFTGPLLGGLYAFYLKKIRGQSAGIGDAFSGFGPRFGQMLLAKFIPNLLAGLALIPVAIVAVFLVIGAAASNHGGSPNFSFGVPMIIGGVLVLAGFCVMAYFQICWLFTLWLVADKNMTFWPAMSLSRAVVRKHWWQTFLIGIVTGLLLVVGLLLCMVGALVTGPLCFAIWAYAYERLFGDLQSAA